jgi:hypothetical protein
MPQKQDDNFQEDTGADLTPYPLSLWERGRRANAVVMGKRLVLALISALLWEKGRG